MTKQELSELGLRERLEQIRREIGDLMQQKRRIMTILAMATKQDEKEKEKENERSY